MAVERRSPDDILCIALLHAYAPWLDPGAPADGIAEHVDAVECSVAQPASDDLGIASRRGILPLKELLRDLPRDIRLHLHVSDTRVALLATEIARETGSSHRVTLIANRIGTLQAIALADQRIATALLTQDADIAKEAAHRKVADAIVCTPAAADEEMMVLSWENRIRVYVGVLDTKEEILQWIERGADGIRTRRPGLFLQALGPRIIP